MKQVKGSHEGGPEGRMVLDVIDTHTEGEPTRTVLGGLPEIEGSTLLEKRGLLMDKFDWIRTSLLMEPRGHSDQFGALVLPPSHDGMDYDLVYMDVGGYLDMCCHATMGVTAALVEAGVVKPVRSQSVLHFNTPAGVVTSVARFEAGRMLEVTVVDVPSRYLGSTEITVNGKGVEAHFAYGGNSCLIVNGEDLGLEVRRRHLRELIEAGMALKTAASQQGPPGSKSANVDLVMITGEPELPGSHGKNIVVFGGGQFDRSPCGTGTAARLALLHSQGKIDEGEWFVHESIMNTTFKARIVELREHGNHLATVPEITGRAYVTQRSQVIIDPRDPLWMGFRA